MEKTANNRSGLLSVIAVFFGFFIMGFVDVVGIASNYVKSDFKLTDTFAKLLPMMVFLWFFVFSIPSGILMGKIGRKNTVLLSVAITAVAMVIPFVLYNFAAVLVAFALLGISNTILQVALNPLVSAMFTKEKTASMLTMGQFLKAISSFLGPIIAGVASSAFGDWKIIFVVFAATSLLSILLLAPARVNEAGYENTPATFGSTLALLGNKYILFCFLCIFLIVGLDVGMNTVSPQLLMERTGLPLEKAGYATSIYFAARTIGAFLGTFLLLKIHPKKFLNTSLIIAILAFAALMFASGQWLLYILIFIIGFACANVFSIVFSLALQKLPARSNEISALMIMGVVGGAIVLLIVGIVSDALGFTAALGVILACLVFILLLAQSLKNNAAAPTAINE